MAVKLQFKLDPSPTFKAPVDIPVHGSATVSVVFEFKHRTRDELDEFYKTSMDRTVDESILAVAVGWELDDEFNAESVAKLTQNYLGAAGAIASAYVREIMQARLGN